MPGEIPSQMPGAETPRRTVMRRSGEKKEQTTFDKPWILDFDERKGRGYTGKEFEHDAFGTVPMKDAYVTAMKAFLDKRGRRNATQAELFDVVRQQYGGDPSHPPTEFADALRKRVVEVSGLTPDKADRIKFYSTVDNPAIDLVLGVDGWMELEAGRKHLVATLDATINPEKEPKANLVVDRVPVSSTEPHFEAAVDYYAKKIWERIQSEMKVNNVRPESI